MKKNIILITLLALGMAACQSNRQEAWMSRALDVASGQLKTTAQDLNGMNKIPRSVYAGYNLDFLDSQLQRSNKAYLDSIHPNPPAGQLKQKYLCEVEDWTSGFFPGSLWYAYEMTGDEELKAQAIAYTNLLNRVRYMKNTHDVGFMIHCSYGNALRLAPNDTIQAVIVETADNLLTRFNPEIGCIRSWDFGTWNFPVIIDNMMNLDLLFNATRLTGDSRYYNAAIKHAQTTMLHHFRPDFTSFHVVSYHNDGTVERRQTHQGKNDASAWSRGQAWGLYGYTACYRESKDPEFLLQARRIASLIMERVKTDDAIPFWDWDAPDTPETPRDASAAAITASAMMELSTLVEDGKPYFDYAERVIRSLSSDAYLAKPGTNQGFVLMHSTGSLPHGSEIDTPLNYADYYYLEALARYKHLKGI